MSNPHLRPCVGCARHIRVSESSCPFCGAALDPVFRASPAPRPPAGRLARAALFAATTGTTLAVGAITTVAVSSATVDCGGKSEEPPANLMSYDAYGLPPLEDAGPNGNLMVDAAYGIAPLEDGQANTTVPYGLPPIPDGDVMVDAAYGAVPTDADVMADAAYGAVPTDADVMADAAYGEPPHFDGGDGH